jgi:hypothetical protein
MGIRKFLTSVADVYGYDMNDQLVLTAKTLLDSSIEVSLGSAPVRAGRGNQLQYIYYHTSEMKFTLTDAQWNLALLGQAVGDSPSPSGYNYYTQEDVVMSGSTGSVSGSPLAYSGTTIYGWATNPTGDTQRVTFTGKNFTVSGSVAGTWCVRYYQTKVLGGDGITIRANMIPKVVKLVMETQLNSSDISTNKIGIVQIIVPSCQLSGAFTISMKADGVSNTPLTGTALAYNESVAGCASNPYYAKLIEVIDAGNWYDNVIALAIEGGDFALSVGASRPLSVWAVTSGGGSNVVSNSLLTFTSGSPAKATVGANTGIVTGVSAGTALISAVITAKPTVEASATVTVS